MQGAPLADQFGKGAGVNQLVWRNACEGVGGGVAYAVAAGLDTVQACGGKQVHHIRTLRQWYPIELDVLTCGEVGAMVGQGGYIAQTGYRGVNG